MLHSVLLETNDHLLHQRVNKLHLQIWLFRQLKPAQCNNAVSASKPTVSQLQWSSSHKELEVFGRVRKVLRPHQHVTGHFRGELFQSLALVLS